MPVPTRTLVPGFALVLSSVATAQLPGARPATPQPFVPQTYAKQLGAATYPGGEASFSDVLTCSVRLPTGAVVVAGRTNGPLGEANAGGADLFVARFSRTGDLQWLSQVGAVTALMIPALNGQPGGAGGDASGSEFVSDIVVDDDGTILIAGNSSGSLGETHAGSGDLIVARLSSSGNLLWLRQIGVETAASIVPTPGATSWGDASGGDFGAALALDPNGGFWVTGTTTSDLSERNLAGSSIFLAHFEEDGDLDGFQQIGEVQENVLGPQWSDDYHSSTGIALSASGPIVSMTSEILQGGDLFYSAALLTFDTTGAPVSLRRAPGLLSSISDLTADSGGLLYVTGAYQEVVSDLQYQFDAVVACYDPKTSQFPWIRRLDQTQGASLGLSDLSSNEGTRSLALDPTGRIVVSGTTYGSLDESNAGGADFFIMKVAASNGAIESVHQLGAATAASSGRDLSGDDIPYDMHLSPRGLIGVVGSTTGSLAEPSGGSTDGVVLRLPPDGRLN